MSDRQEEFSKNLEEFVDEFKQKMNFDRLIDLVDWVSQFDTSDIKTDTKSNIRSEVRTQVSFTAQPLSSIPRRGNIPRNPVTRGSSPIPSTSAPDINVETFKQKAQQKESVKDNLNINNQNINDAVGGLGDTLKQLRNLVEIPLKRPEILEKLGIEPPKGILLVGAPGTGKTLTARSLAQTLGVNYISIVAPEIMSKYYGEAEAKLREIFEKATTSKPCLIFIDEIDALMPKRSQVEGEVEKRIVAQMLGLMDGFKNNSGVIILAATNRPESLDPALRRPGRFDQEIIFPVPDVKARTEILAIHSRNMPLGADVDLRAIAEIAHGFVGADLKGLCQTAAYIALERQVSDLDSIPETLQVQSTDFIAALQKVKPAVLRSLTLESPQVLWSEIGGLASIKQNLQEAVSGYLSNSDLYEYVKARPPRGILLAGAPGTGKTLLAKAIATEAKANFIAIAASELLSKWVGASEQGIKELFSQARQAKPCVIFIDEIDTLAPARGSNQGDCGISDRLIGQLLTELDGINSAEGILLVAATNRPESIDPALLRSGRIELHITVGLPDLAARRQILEIHNSDRPCNLDLEQWATLTAGCNGADLAFLSNRAAVFAIRRHQSTLQTDPSLTVNSLEINGSDFEQALQELRNPKV